MEGATTATVLLMGRPGSGKGTQAKLLADAFGWKSVSSGARFKEIRDGEGPLGKRVRQAYDAGKLLPDWFPTYLLQESVLNVGSEQGVVCEGFARTRTQAEAFDDIMTWLERPYVALNLEVPEEEALRRQVERAKTEHRPDSDAEEKVRARFAEYRRNTEPALAYFREKGLCVDIDGTPDIDTIHRDILSRLSRGV